MENISQLEPKELWQNFYALTQIPRPSKKEQKAVDYLLKFGKDLGLETKQDKIGNVIIKKPATKGYENKKTIVLQSHIDMVPQKNSDTDHNFETDPIKTIIDGDWVTAEGTTLGADNGIGLAAIMAVLQADNLKHGPIEALLTIDEETGMTGAFGLEPGILDGDILLNLDSEDEGELYVGCAGGSNANISIPCTYTTCNDNCEGLEINLTGLKGGHSGMDIVLGRGNANKLMFRVIKELNTKFGACLSSINGGSLRNAIPREAFATMCVPSTKINEAKELVKQCHDIFYKELKATEPNLSLSCKVVDKPKEILTPDSQKAIINTVLACPNGVVRMSDSMPGLVETSLNLAIVQTDDKNCEIMCLIRSSVDSAKDNVEQELDSLISLAGGKVEFTGQYPGWQPNMDSEILGVMSEVYKELYNKVPEIKGVHAGLECGILGATYPKWDMISFGPTIRFPHSPDEKVNIPSVAKFWDYLTSTLEKIN